MIIIQLVPAHIEMKTALPFRKENKHTRKKKYKTNKTIIITIIIIIN